MSNILCGFWLFWYVAAGLCELHTKLYRLAHTGMLLK